MGTTFVSIGSRGFWMRDGVLELWLRFLALHIEEPTEHENIKRQIRDQWLLASRGYFVGCVPEALEKSVSTPEGRRIVLDAIASLMSALCKAPGTLDKGVLNLIGMETKFVGDFETWRLMEVGEAFKNLIDGKIDSTAAETKFMPGCRDKKMS